MIHHEVDLEQGLLFITPEGELEETDFNRLTAAAAQLHKKGKLHGLVIHVHKFPGWQDFATFLAHVAFVKQYASHFKRVAVSTDNRVFSVLPKIATHFVSAEVRHFDYDKLDEATKWAAE